jgi:hypothetical protein
VDYPAHATIEESQGGTYSIGETRKDIPFSAASCVIVHKDFGAVAVSGPDDPGNASGETGMYCGLVNIQTSGGQSESKTLTVENQAVTAEGYFNSAHIGIDGEPFFQTEWLTFKTPGGFRVVYRLDPASDADLARYDHVRATLETIAQSIRAQ